MPKKEMALVAGGPKDLVVHWGAFFRNARVEWRGEPVLTFATKAELRQGGTASLSDGSRLFVRLTDAVLTVRFEVLRDGIPVPGSATDPDAEIGQATGIFAFVGVMTTLVSAGALATLGAAEGAPGLVEGLLFCGAAFGAHRRSKAAVIAGTVLLALDTLFIVVSQVASGQPGAIGGVVGGLVVRAIFFRLLYNAIRAFDQRAVIRGAEVAKAFE